MNRTPNLQVVFLGLEPSHSLSPETQTNLAFALLDTGYQCHAISSLESLTEIADPSFIYVLKDKASMPPIAHDASQVLYYQNQESVDAFTQRVQALDVSPDKAANKKTWKPWFPVIDYDRCTNCMQCLSFCLFDVYAVKDNTITVQNQDKCKTDCPACSRVCPETAILFPKYNHAPINGAEVSETHLSKEKVKVDISNLLGGDIYSSLRERSEGAKSRFSKERSEGRALKERRRCLGELKEKLDIPDSVLQSLPDDETIQKKLSEY
ncbi:MAG: ferredoxin family protein [Planctomycetes bacterium]|nr:ferredoxin family protein [Planctomycetota bacterium]